MRIFRLYEGTSEIQRVIIAREMMKQGQVTRHERQTVIPLSSGYHYMAAEESNEPCAACGRVCVEIYEPYLRAAAGLAAICAPDRGSLRLRLKAITACTIAVDEEPSDELAWRSSSARRASRLQSVCVASARWGFFARFLGLLVRTTISPPSRGESRHRRARQGDGRRGCTKRRLIFRTLDGADYIATLDLD